ncbi:MAG: hypothetical protein JSV62_06595 [Promethearchaeota archaeon]|nr:MAG: hypothetical protein JSV62_06595 [Candidatus Lokiarchaeota archaeon]
MDENNFREFLSKNNVATEKIASFILRLKEFDDFLKYKDYNIDSFPKGEIINYTEYLITNSKDTVFDLLRALINYGNFIKNYDYIVEIIDISESYNAMDNLNQRIAEKFGEKLRDKIFDNIEIPPLGVDPEKKPEFTKAILKRLEEKIGKEKSIELLKPCLHGRPGDIKKDREDFLRLNDIDEFLKLKKQELIGRLQQHQKEGTLEFAQYINEEVIDFVKKNPSINPGIREGDKIITTKLPYQTKRHMKTKDKRMKGFYSCYCPWVRGAIKNGTDQEISSYFCYCSAGYTKKYWDIIFDQPVEVEPIETPLTGGTLCKFAVQIPKEFQKKIE